MPPRENKLDLDTVVTLGVIVYPDVVCYQYAVRTCQEWTKDPGRSI